MLGQAIGQPRDPELPPTLLYLQVDGIEPLASHYGAAARDLFLKSLWRCYNDGSIAVPACIRGRSRLRHPAPALLARGSACDGHSPAARDHQSTVRYHSERFKIGASIGVLTLRDQTADPEALLESAFLASQAA